MKVINNLSYSIAINYINSSGLDTSISVALQDNGLETRSIKVGNVCVTEETINGRVLSGRLDNSDGYCGYKYDYQNGEYLLSLNPKISINTAASLINKTKMKSDFLSAKMVLSSISRNDYRVVILNKGNLNVVKTVSAENENSEKCTLQESMGLLKLDGEESFVETSKKTLYKTGDNSVVVDSDIAEDDINCYLIELSAIMSQNPKNYKELLELKNQVQNKSLTIQ